MGCQKQFFRNYKSTEKSPHEATNQSATQTFAVAAFWLLLNAVIDVCYFLHLIDEGILLLLSLAFSVCDMICILFFCPFQTWVMKNKCCINCRIYNWDYAMMFTPLLFVGSFYTWSLLAFALALLIRWEVTYRSHPERFSETTIECLFCKNCTEKLCHHKKQLQHFLFLNRKQLNLKECLPVKYLRKNRQQKDSDPSGEI